jgi:hypothetical protein
MGFSERSVIGPLLSLMLFGSAPAVLGKDKTDEFLLERPAISLNATTWRIIFTQEKASTTTLQSKVLISVVKGITKSVVVKESTGYKTADDEILNWIKTKWRFRSGVTDTFTLPVYIPLSTEKESVARIDLSKSELATLRNPESIS